MNYRVQSIGRLLLCLITPAMGRAAPLAISWSDRDASGCNDAEKAVVDAAITMVQSALSSPQPRTVVLSIKKQPLSGQRGETSSPQADALGNPVGASIIIDSGTEFFVDPTPFDNEEFEPADCVGKWLAIPGSPADGKHDLLRVVVHELCHALGFAGAPSFWNRFSSRFTGPNGLTYIGDGGLTAEFANLGHLDDPCDLMGYPPADPSVRFLPSDLDIRLLNDAFDYAGRRIYEYEGEPIPVPDGGVLAAELVVPDQLRIRDVDVAFYIIHGRDQDLDISLVSPAGTRVELSSDNGLGGFNYGWSAGFTRFDDESLAYHVSPEGRRFWGTYAPEGTLSAFDGEQGDGTWILEIADDTLGTTGTLQALVISIAVQYRSDFDTDGDIDDDDCDIFESCATGPGVGPPGADCEEADLDADGDVDQADFSILQRCISGSGVMPAPECMN